MMSRSGAPFALLLAVMLLPLSARALVIADVLPIYAIHDFEIADGLAYVSIGAWGQTSQVPSVRILDLSDPAAPVEIGFFETPHATRDVEVAGGLAYITQPSALVRIIDVSDPTLPVEIGAFSGECHAADVEVVGNYAYLADQPTSSYVPECSWGFESKLRVFDVSNPAVPIQVSETDIDWPVDLEAIGGVVYAAGFGGTELIDVSDPAAPVTVGVAPAESWIWDIDVEGGYLYAVSTWARYGLEGYGLEVFDVSDPANPLSVGRSVAYGMSIEVVDGFAYVGAEGLQVVDVSDPAVPRRRGSIYAQIRRVDPRVYGGYAYLATSDGLRVVDCSLLNTPIEVGWAEVVGADGDVEVLNDIAVSDGVAYLAVEEDDDDDPSTPPWVRAGGLRIYDVSDPTAPARLSGIDTADVALDVELQPGLAFVAAGTDGLRVFDVANPRAPVSMGAVALPGFTAKLEVVGATAYVVDRGIGSHRPRALRLVDVSDAAAPVQLGAIEFTDAGSRCEIPGIAVAHPLVYVTCNGLYIVDVSDPTQPRLVDSDRSFVDRRPSSVAIAGNRMYRGVHMGQYGDSLAVYDISNPTQPVYIDRAFGVSDRAIVIEDGFAYSVGDYGGLSVHGLEGPQPPVFRGGYPPDRGGWNGLAISDGLVFGVTNRGYLQVVDLGAEYKHSRAVEIAIRAEREPAVVNLASRGVIGVAVLGAADFDVARIDRSTLRFGPSIAAPTHKAGGHLEDVNGDAMPDIVSHYRIADSGISEADKSACVSAETTDGTPIIGCGAIAAVLPRGQIRASGVAD